MPLPGHAWTPAGFPGYNRLLTFLLLGGLALFLFGVRLAGENLQGFWQLNLDQAESARRRLEVQATASKTYCQV